jgi:hypothetical protein
MAGYTAVRTLQNPKVGIACTLVLVFLVGAVVGALAMNLGVHKVLHRAPFWTDPGKQISLQRLQKELDLTPDQTEQLKTALDDFSRYYQDVLAIGKTSIYKILNEQQKRKFDQLMNDAQK